MGFMDLKIKIKEKFKLKENSLRQLTFKNQFYAAKNYFSFQTPFKFLKSIHWLWKYITSGARDLSHFAVKKKHKKRGRIAFND